MNNIPTIFNIWLHYSASPMTSSTAERVQGHFVLERLGERRLKNVADPVQVYRLIQPGVYDRVVRGS